jgi:hypothetical protein
MTLHCDLKVKRKCLFLGYMITSLNRELLLHRVWYTSVTAADELYKAVISIWY